MQINFLYVLVFAAGMITQAFMMLGGRWKAGDAKAVLISFACGLVGLAPGKNEHNYDLSLHLFFSCVLAAFYFTGNFRKRLISRIGARTLIVLNIITLFVVQNQFGLNKYIFLALLIPSVLTLINGFTNMDRHFGWQVFFYTWFSIMIIIIALVHFAFNDLMKIFGWGEGNGEISYFNNFLIGSAFLYIIANVWYVIQLIPLTKKHQKFSERLIEMKDYMQLLAYGYVWQAGDFLGNFLVLIILPIFLVINHQAGLIKENILISLVLAFMPFVSRLNSSVAVDGDGIGLISNAEQA